VSAGRGGMCKDDCNQNGIVDEIERKANGFADTISPSMVCPSDILVEKDGPDGAKVEYALPSAIDSCDPSPLVVCDPPSGGIFPPGETVVTCEATDESGNSTVCQFKITVVCPAEGDTHCLGLSVDPPGGPPGTYLAIASATDESGDSILYTFTADNGKDPQLVIGPQKENMAAFDLTRG